MLDFPGRIWEIWTGSDTIRISQIRDGKWLAEHGGQVCGLAFLIMYDLALFCKFVTQVREEEEAQNIILLFR